MGRKNNPRFVVGAYWMKIGNAGRFGNLHGTSLWQIVEEQSKGYRILKKVEQLRSGRIYRSPNNGVGQTKQMTCESLEKYAHWQFVENPDTVRVLYGKEKAKKDILEK